MEKEKRRTYAVCAYTFSPPFRSQQTKFCLGPALCTEHIWCKYRNTWEDSFRTSTSYADPLAEHSQLSAKPTASLSDPTFCVMLHGDCNPGYQRHIRNPVLCWFGHLSVTTQTPEHKTRKQSRNCVQEQRKMHWCYHPTGAGEQTWYHHKQDLQVLHTRQDLASRSLPPDPEAEAVLNGM